MRKIRALLVLTFVVIVFIVPGRIQADNRGELLAAQGSEELDTYAPDGRFIPGDRRGVVKDTKTGLEWFAGPDKDTTWDEAKAWTESLSVDGGGWRMPTRDEVKGLHTKGAGPHNVSPLFGVSVSILGTSTFPAAHTPRLLAVLPCVLEKDDGLTLIPMNRRIGPIPCPDFIESVGSFNLINLMKAIKVRR
jgi:hypothetical protein